MEKYLLLAMSIALTACNQTSVTIEGLTFDTSIRTEKTLVMPNE